MTSGKICIDQWILPSREFDDSKWSSEAHLVFLSPSKRISSRPPGSQRKFIRCRNRRNSRRLKHFVWSAIEATVLARHVTSSDRVERIFSDAAGGKQSGREMDRGKCTVLFESTPRAYPVLTRCILRFYCFIIASALELNIICVI